MVGRNGERGKEGGGNNFHKARHFFTEENGQTEILLNLARLQTFYFFLQEMCKIFSFLARKASFLVQDFASLARNIPQKLAILARKPLARLAR